MKTTTRTAQTLPVTWLALAAGAASPMGAADASNHGAIGAVQEFVAALAPATLVSAGEPSESELKKVMQLWCTQAGTWTGMIDVTSPDGKMQRMELVTSHDCTESAQHHIVRERFGLGLSTVKVTFIDVATKPFQTNYFAGGKESPFRFVFVSVEASDDTHWKTIIASAPGFETYEGRQATLRYIRVRDGDTVTSWKDVQFVGGAQDFEPRSRIVQTLRR